MTFYIVISIDIFLKKKNNKSKKRLSKFTMKYIIYNIKHVEKKPAFSLLNGFLV